NHRPAHVDKQGRNTPGQLRGAWQADSAVLTTATNERRPQMLALAIIAALIIIAILIVFRTDFMKQSLTVGVRSPVELRDLPGDLLQHIRETDYVWQEVVAGSYVGVL